MNAASSPVVSVLLPFRDSEDTLADAVYSIVNQSLEDWELLLIDDGSSGASADIAATLASGDSRIRLLANPGKPGIVGALQVGTAQARGAFIARMDADDSSHPERLAAQLRHMRNDPSLGLCGAQVKVFGPAAGPGRRRYERWLNGLEDHDAIVRDLFIECPVAHPAFFMSRSALEHVGGYLDRGWPEDYDLVMRLWLAGYRISNVPRVLLHWRDEADRLSRTNPYYSEAAFRQVKLHYLSRTYLAEGRPFFQWGAGEVGKRWLRDWPAGMRPQAVVDVNPRKIGRRIHGFPVISPDDLPTPRECFAVAAVGAPDARETIRAWFSERNYRETESYLFLA